MRIQSRIARDTMRHPDVFEMDVRPASAVEKSDARLYVNRHAKDVADLAFLIAMLGIEDEGVQ